MEKRHRFLLAVFVALICFPQLGYGQELTEVMKEFKSVCTQTRDAIGKCDTEALRECRAKVYEFNQMVTGDLQMIPIDTLQKEMADSLIKEILNVKYIDYVLKHECSDIDFIGSSIVYPFVCTAKKRIHYKYMKKNSNTYRISMGDISGNYTYDPARVIWGGSWRLPTEDELEELISNCDSEWTTQDGVNGRRFTSKKNGKSIFLPAAGLFCRYVLRNVGVDGDYWGSIPNEISYFADTLGFNDSELEVGCSHLDSYLSVRPVSD